MIQRRLVDSLLESEAEAGDRCFCGAKSSVADGSPLAPKIGLNTTLVVVRSTYQPHSNICPTNNKHDMYYVRTYGCV